jgi:hypothetical protein
MKRRRTMDALWVVAAVAAWIVLQAWVLPKLGFET